MKSKLNHKHLLHVDNYPNIATVLKVCKWVNVLYDLITSLKDSSHTHPNVHIVWPTILGIVKKKGDLAIFWKAVVDGTDCILHITLFDTCMYSFIIRVTYFVFP